MVNKMGVYGTPETIWIHDEPRTKYPTEVEACARIFDPSVARFVTAPVGPLQVWCCGCRKLHDASAFHRHAGRPSGFQQFCKAYQKAHRKAKRLKQHSGSGHWYRG